MKNGFVKAIVTMAVTILGMVTVAPLFGAHIPESIWGIAIGTMASLAGTLIPAGKEKYELSVPASAKVQMEVKIEE